MDLLNKDSVWNRIKGYIFFIIFLVTLLIMLLISIFTLNVMIYTELLKNKIVSVGKLFLTLSIL